MGTLLPNGRGFVTVDTTTNTIGTGVKVPAAQVSGSLPASQISGSLPASQVSGLTASAVGAVPTGANVTSLKSTDASSGQVPVADGNGGIAWSTPAASGGSSVVTATTNYAGLITN